jgi:hypothetical protein
MYMRNQTQDFHYETSIQQEEDAFHQQIRLKFKDEPSEMLYFEHSFVWCWNLDTSKSRSETPREFLNVVLEKDRVDQLARSYEKWRTITKSQGREEYPANNKKKKS